MYITGDGEFSDQLYDTLNYIEDDHLFYMLDDYWIKFPIDFNKYWHLITGTNMDALRLQPNVTFRSRPYRFSDSKWNKVKMLKQTPESEYRISMNTSIWRREYFLECLTPGLNPWQLEVTVPDLGDVYFVPELPFWYINGTVKGVLTKEGREVMDGI